MAATAVATPYPMDTVQNKRDGFMKRYTRLKEQRSDWIYHWDELGRHILPRSFRFFIDDRNRGGKWRYGSILDNTPTMCLRTLSAGVMSHMTSPGRPWIKLTVQDAELKDSHEVQMWLDAVTSAMLDVFSESNLYRVLPKVYNDLGCYGTAAMMVLTDAREVIHAYHLTLGEYCLAQNWDGKIDTCYRGFQRTVVETVDEFGFENCSRRVQNDYNNRDYDAPVNILHVVEPRPLKERRPGSPLSKHMPVRSVYLEIDGDDGKLLRESGFRRMRVLAPRWETDGSDVYGSSPGMDALGDIRQLNQQQFRKSQAIAYKAKPPLQIPHQMRGRNSMAQPGGVSYYEPGMMIPFDQNGPHGGIRTAFEVNLDIRELHEDNLDVRARIENAFYKPLFMMFAGIGESARMTIPEVMEKQGEKLLSIGSVVERISDDLLEPLVDITFEDMMALRRVPPLPPELFGATIEVEFTSVLAQAQKAVGITGIQMWLQDNIAAANIKPDVIDNVDFDEWSRMTGRMRGVPAKMIVPSEKVQELRDARARAEAAQAQIEAMNTQANTVQQLSQAPVDQDSALTAAVDMLNGTPEPV